MNRLAVLLALAALGVPAQTLPVRNGTFAQIAVGHFPVGDGRGSWKTTLVFTNLSSAGAAVTARWYASNGTPLQLPVTGGGILTEIRVGMPPYGTARVEFDEEAVPLSVGWVDVTSTTSIRGQGLYRVRAPGRAAYEAAVPLLVREPSTCLVPLPQSTSLSPGVLVLPYNNTGGYVTSVAFANTTSEARTLILEAVNDYGKSVFTTTINMAAREHRAFATTDYPALRNTWGVLRVLENPAAFSGIAFLFNPDGPFTTLLPIPQ